MVHINAVNPAAQCQLAAAAQLNLPRRGRRIGKTKTELRLGRVKLILPVHPGQERADKILQRLGQHPRLEPRARRLIQQAFPVTRRKPCRNRADAVPGLGGGEIAPMFALRRHLVVKGHQDLMLETAAFPRIHLEQFPFPGMQAGLHKEPEGALRELLQAAHRGAQHGSVQPVGEDR